jgi:hypothetical protein
MNVGLTIERLRQLTHVLADPAARACVRLGAPSSHHTYLDR